MNKMVYTHMHSIQHLIAIVFIYRNLACLLKGKVTLHQAMEPKFYYASHGSTTNSGRQSPFHLSSLTWLGFDYSQRDNDTAIREFIKQDITQYVYTVNYFLSITN